jgi:UDP-N-acetylglucosamine 3-dehydrogenase
MKELRAAVIGVGAMGRHHVRILGGMRGVSLDWVVDRDTVRASELAEPWGAKVLDSVEDLPEIDIAVVAVPTELHHAIASELMERGVSVMVEKPLAFTVGEAADLVLIAKEKHVTLAVGHVERFNAVVRTLAAMKLEPAFLQFERLSPFTPRITSNVVSDLMVHDLDLACMLANARPVRVEAAAVTVFSDSADVATAILEFPGGVIASLSASRATQDKVRQITVTERERYIVADCLRQDILVKRETSVEFPPSEPNLYRQANVVEIPYLDRSGEPLTLELTDFVAAVRQRRRPAVSGDDGLRAVEVVAEVERAAGIA